MERHPFRRIVIAAAVIFLFAAAIWVLLFRVNRFSLSVELAGDKEITLEYGQPYQEPGVQPVFRGTWLLREGISPENASVTVSGEADTAVVGRYDLTYSAHWLWFYGECRRTVRVVDKTPPVITLKEETRQIPAQGAIYEEPGYSAWDEYDGDLTDRVLITHSMGKVTYVAIDSSGNMSYVDREVPYHDPVPPEITLVGGDSWEIPAGTRYVEPGYEARDNVDGNLTQAVTVSADVDWLRPGIYPVSYRVSDAYGNETVVIRDVEVTAAPRPEIRWPENRSIYLTFDDGPGPYTRELLDLLDAYGVKASFFVVDSEYRGLMKEITDRGHTIGIHSVTHDYEAVYASAEAFFEDLYAMRQIIYETTGVKTNLMRFPGGSSNEVSRNYCEGIMTFLTEAVQDAGFRYFDWNVDSDDAGAARRAKTVRQNVVDGVLETGIAVVLQHDIHGYSVEAVEDILIWGLENGYTFLPLEEDSPSCHHPLLN